MNASKLNDKTLNDLRNHSFSSLAEDNSQTSISSVITNVSDHKVNFTARRHFILFYYITH